MTAKYRRPVAKPVVQQSPVLPEAELEVLAQLWHGGAATAAQLRDKLSAFRPMTHGALKTLLGRLAAKGLVSREKAARGKAFIYQAVPQPEPTYRRLVDRLVTRVFGGDSLKLVASLLATRPPTEEELVQLRALVRQHQHRPSLERP